VDEVDALVLESIPRTRVIGIVDDLRWAVKGGRVPGWIKGLFGLLRLSPVLTANPQGKLGIAGFHAGMGADPRKLAATAVGKMRPDTMYRVVIAHANNLAGARETRHHILQRHGQIHSCHITEAGPALGVHFGPGGLIVGFTPQPEVLS